jgi:hypothetical protein
MTIKYKLGFTIDSETLFGILSKFLPIQDLSVEEVMEPLPAGAQAILDAGRKLTHERAKQVRKTKGSGYALNPFAGANAIILAAFSDGEPHPGNICFTSMKAAGFATNGIYGKFERLRRHKLMFQPRPGLWQLTPEGKKAWEQRPSQESAA